MFFQVTIAFFNFKLQANCLKLTKKSMKILWKKLVKDQTYVKFENAIIDTGQNLINLILIRILFTRFCFTSIVECCSMFALLWILFLQSDNWNVIIRLWQCRRPLFTIRFLQKLRFNVSNTLKNSNLCTEYPSIMDCTMNKCVVNWTNWLEQFPLNGFWIEIHDEGCSW